MKRFNESSLAVLIFLFVSVALIAQEGLLVHYSFDQGAGVDVLDVSGNGNDAAMHNMGDTTWIDGKMGTALSFNGVDQYVKSVPFSTPLELDFSVSFWFKATPDQNSRAICLNMEQEQLINIRINNNQIGIDGDGGMATSGTMYGDPIVTDGEWHHFVVVRSEIYMILYLDGDFLLERELEEVFPHDNITLGARNNTDGSISNHMSGALDDCRVYSRALSQDDVAALAQGESAVAEKSSFRVERFQLFQNHPNPFNPSTHIRYALAESGQTNLTIYDIQGKVVETLVNEYQPAGYYSIQWNAADRPSGLYFYQLNSQGSNVTKKLLLQK